MQVNLFSYHVGFTQRADVLVFEPADNALLVVGVVALQHD